MRTLDKGIYSNSLFLYSSSMDGGQELSPSQIPQPAKLTGAEAMLYRKEILQAAKGLAHSENFEPVVTIQITEETTYRMMEDAFDCGVRVCKVYPRYVTTHSEHGVVDYTKIYPALSVAERLGMIVQFHPEHPSFEVPGRKKEARFRKILNAIRKKFPRLKISVEHVSSRLMINWVKSQPKEFVGASIAVHYLYQTADDLAGYSERSGGLICVHDGGFKPGAKDPEDREALWEAILSGDSRFWYGGDDAAHLKSKKETARGSCGSWSTMAANSLLLSGFEQRNALERYEPFTSEFWAAFYGYPLNTGQLTFKRQSWKVRPEVPVPTLNDSVVPFYAGETMEWTLVDD